MQRQPTTVRQQERITTVLQLLQLGDDAPLQPQNLSQVFEHVSLFIFDGEHRKEKDWWRMYNMQTPDPPSKFCAVILAFLGKLKMGVTALAALRNT